MAITRLALDAYLVEVANDRGLLRLGAQARERRACLGDKGLQLRVGVPPHIDYKVIEFDRFLSLAEVESANTRAALSGRAARRLRDVSSVQPRAGL